MLLSKNLLLTIVPGLKKYDQDELMKAFNSVGIEVENVLKMPHIPGLTIGLVKHKEQHPTRPHLNVCIVEIDGKDTQIECGAPNVAVGYAVVVAQIGTKLPGGKIIGAKDVGGVISYGMLCSYAEVNPEWAQFLPKNENNGIILLPEALYHQRKTVDEVLGLDDTIFDLFIPTNRNDLNGLIFLANELKAALDSNFVYEDISLGEKNQLDIQIQSNDVQSFNWCQFQLKEPYGATSWFWKRFMINSGIHLTNTIADLANFITALTANPVHFYDADGLQKNQIVVKNLAHDAEFTGLNHQTYTLKRGDLVVMSGDEIISLPGIIGSLNHAVHAETKNIVVEIGTFDSHVIQKTAKRLKISTPSVERFGKKLSANLAGITWLLAQNLILKEYGTNFQVLFAMSKWQQTVVDASVEKINKILGTRMHESDFQEILQRTCFQIHDGKIIVPSHRTDIYDAQDIAEEVMKSININDFKPQQIIAPVLIQHDKSYYQKIQELRQLLINKQFFEVKTYNLTSTENAQKFNWFQLQNFVQLLDPLSRQRETFRGSMIPQMLAVLRDNLNRRLGLKNIFEIQKLHYGYQNFDCLTVICSTDLFHNPLDASGIKNNVLLPRNIWEIIAQQFQIECQITPDVLPEAYPEHCLAIKLNGEKIGFIAQLKNGITSEYGLKNINALVLNLNPILNAKNQGFQMKAIGELHPIFRDLTFIVPNSFQIQPLLDDFQTVWTEATLTDCFERDGVVTYTVQLKFVPDEKTPTAEEINAIYQEALQKLSEHHLALK